MTERELYTKTCALIGETEADSDETFYTGANIALDTINKLRPQKNFLAISKYDLPVITGSNIPIKHTPNERIEISADGTHCVIFSVKCYSDQSAEVDIIVNGTMRKTVFAKNETIREIVGDGAEVRLVFKGNGNYIISQYAFYSASPEDERQIPDYRSGSNYDMLVEVDDFLSFTDDPVIVDGRSGRIGEDYILRSRNIFYIPCGKEGRYEIPYNHKPERITEDTQEIDIAPELEELLPLLTAYYTHLDVDFTVAQEFLRRYNEMASQVIVMHTRESESLVENVTGW